jgi:hypothetical protein
LEVFDRVKRVRHAQTPRRIRDELHQSSGTYGRTGVRVAIAVFADDKVNKLRSNSVLRRNPIHRIRQPAIADNGHTDRLARSGIEANHTGNAGG